jgi:hypothetical protein
MEMLLSILFHLNLSNTIENVTKDLNICVLPKAGVWKWEPLNICVLLYAPRGQHRRWPA